MKKTMILLAAMMLPMSMLAGCGDAKTSDTKAAVNGGPSIAAAAPDRSGGSSPAPAEPAAAPAAESAGDAGSAEDAAGKKDAKLAAGEALSAADALSPAESYDAGDIAMRAERVEFAAKSEKAGEGESVRGAESPELIPPEQQPPQDDAAAFVLTAGEWNDNKNWGFFSNLVSNRKITFPAYGLDPVNRVAAKVDLDGRAARNITVELLSEDGDVLWAAKTDKTGSAYLFFPSGMDTDKLTVRAEGQTAALMVQREPGGADTQTEPMTFTDAEAVLHLTEGEAPVYDKTEVMFILDATGSMGDEMLYLQKDFSAIAAETAGRGVTFSVNFYRDKGDQYVTKCSDFSDDITEIQRLLNEQRATGGGDSPEAVAEILDETMQAKKWSKDANKIAFLIFDAPPHDDSGSIAKIQKAVAQAAAQGIHIVPVVSSNSDRGTELFGRALSLMTNSNYVFLTDDSGVGGSHLEPIIGDYDVEKLHDIIIRNIKEISN